jgi:hypothetical protein
MSRFHSLESCQHTFFGVTININRNRVLLGYRGVGQDPTQRHQPTRMEGAYTQSQKGRVRKRNVFGAGFIHYF